MSDVMPYFIICWKNEDPRNYCVCEITNVQEINFHCAKYIKCL